VKVIYKKPVIERLLDVIYEAKAQNKVIESIELDKAEYQELQSHCYSRRPAPITKREWEMQLKTAGLEFMGVPIRCSYPIAWRRPQPYSEGGK
jgi:hypothetical protein